MKIPKLKLKKVTDFLKKLPRILGEHSSLTFFGFLLIALILGGFVFYQYSFLAEKEKPEAFQPLKFKEKTYEAILKTWQEKEKRLEETDFKEYPDPFLITKEETGEKEELSPPESGAEETQEISETECYDISKGETLWELAERYLGSGERWREIKTENGQTFTENSAEVIPIGQRLIIPLK